MMFNRFMTILALVSTLALPLAAKEKAAAPFYGFVNSEACFSNSLRGKKVNEELDKQRSEIEKMLKDLEAQLLETNRKRTDQDHLDTLSPQAIEELNHTYAYQIEEMKRAQAQASQYLQQIQGRSLTQVHADIKRAAEKVAKDRNLDAVIPCESTFFSKDEFNVTAEVIKVMDENFIAESKS